MFSMGASVVFACDVGSVSTTHFRLLTNVSHDIAIARWQLSSEFWRYGLWLVAVSEQMEPLLECKTCPCNHWNPEQASIVCIYLAVDVGSPLIFNFSVSSVKTLEEAKVTKGCLYIQMPVHEVRWVPYKLDCIFLTLALHSTALSSTANSRKFFRRDIRLASKFCRNSMTKADFHQHLLMVKRRLAGVVGRRGAVHGETLYRMNTFTTRQE